MEKGVNRKRGAFELPHFVLDGKKNYIPWAQAMGWARVRVSAVVEGEGGYVGVRTSCLQ